MSAGGKQIPSTVPPATVSEKAQEVAVVVAALRQAAERRLARQQAESEQGAA